MHTGVATLGVFVIIGGFFIALYNSFTVLGMRFYPYWEAGAIVAFFGLIIIVFALLDKTESPTYSARSQQHSVRHLDYIGGHPDYKIKTIGVMHLSKRFLDFQSFTQETIMDLKILRTMIVRLEIDTWKHLKNSISTEVTIQVLEKIQDQTNVLVLVFLDESTNNRTLLFDTKNTSKEELNELLFRIYPDRRKEDLTNNDALLILKNRYAKGEITKEQLDEMKRTLEE